MLIVTGSDNNYVPGVLVLIASTARHNPNAEFVVLDLGISHENKGRIASLGQEIGARIRQIEIKSNTFDRLAVGRGHLTRGCYLRLLIPDLLPEESRAIYMDCDMVVIDSLQELADVPLTENAIGAVSCPTVGRDELEATFKTKGTYVNSGLLVMNLDIWRRDKIGERCLALLSSAERSFLCEDQSAINIACTDKIVHLPSRFNVYADVASYPRIDKLPESPAVLHYVVRNKPWSRVTTSDDIWHYHANQISKFMPPLRIEQRYVSRIHRRCKLILGVLSRRRKYLDRLKVERGWRDISRRYLARET